MPSTTRLLETVERTTRSGPSMVVSFGVMMIRRLLFGLYLGAVIGFIIGGQIGHVASTPDEAHVPSEVLDIDIRETEQVDRPLVPDQFEEPAGSSGDAPEWYLDGVQKFLDVMLDIVRVTGNATAQFVYANNWIPLWLTQGLGFMGVTTPLVYHVIRMSRGGRL